MMCRYKAPTGARKQLSETAPTLDFKKAEAAKPERRPEETASKMEPMAHHDMRPGSKFVTTFLRNEDD
jgi:hypothetical protein